MSPKKVISPADGAYGHFNAFGAVVIDQVAEPEPEPPVEEEVEPPKSDVTLTELTDESLGRGKSKAVVHLAEEYTIYEDHGGELIRADSAGHLIIANQGFSDRMYDLSVAFKNTTGVHPVLVQKITVLPNLVACRVHPLAGISSVAVNHIGTTEPDMGGILGVPA